MTTPNQSYLVKQMQYRLAAALGAILWDLGVQARGPKWRPDGNPNNLVWSPTRWRTDRQRFDFKPNWGHSSSRYNAWVEFSNARFDPNRGSIWRGEKKVAENVVAQDDAKTKIIRNGADSPVHVAYEEAVSLTNSFSSSVTKGVTLDMTKSMSSETTASTSVSGEYMGVSAEASLSETFGISEERSKSESTEEAKEKAEEGTHSESLAIEFDASPRSHYLVTIRKEHATSYQPFRIDGVMDFDIHIHMPGYTGPSQQHARFHPGTDVKVVGLAGLEQFVEGFDTDYPAMEGFIHQAYSGTRRAWDWLKDRSHLVIDVEGTSEASLESNASYDVEHLGDSVPDALAHLPVVEAEDV